MSQTTMSEDSDDPKNAHRGAIERAIVDVEAISDSDGNAPISEEARAQITSAKPLEAAEFAAAVNALAANEVLQDPLPALQLLMAAPPSAASAPIATLWKLAVTQKALAEVHTAIGREVGSWCETWTAIESAVAETLAKTGNGALEQAMPPFVEASRAAAALPHLGPLVRQLEGALQRQGMLLGFHFADDNSYRRRERELGEQLAAPKTTDPERVELAKQIQAEVARYRRILVPRLRTATVEASQVYAECMRLSDFFTDQPNPEARRWYELTEVLLDSREKAVEHVSISLELDELMAGEVTANATVHTIVDDGKETIALSSAATARFKRMAGVIGDFVAQSKREEQVREERNALVASIVDQEPEERREAAPQNQTVVQSTSSQTQKHPIENRPWFRLARMTWWVILVGWILLSFVVFPTFQGAAVSSLVVAFLLWAVKSAVFYVTLGRSTLHEPTGSGFVDLDVFEREMFEQSSGAMAHDSRRLVEELRGQYGRRVPGQVLKALVDRRLEDAREKKGQALAEADRQGTRISVDSLRMRMLGDKPSGMTSEAYKTDCERLLLRLEVEHGPEIPVSVVWALVDTDESP